MPKLVVYPFVTRQVSTGQDRSPFPLFHDSSPGQIGQILLLHVNQGRIDHLTTTNLRNTQLVQFLIGQLDTVHKNAATETISFTRYF